MSVKKKAPVAKPVERPAVKRIGMQEPKNRKDGRHPQATAAATSSSAAAAKSAHMPDQLEVFEMAIRLFHARKFREARERFLAARSGSDRGISHKAELHVRMCDRRLEEQ